MIVRASGVSFLIALAAVLPLGCGDDEGDEEGSGEDLAAVITSCMEDAGYASEEPDLAEQNDGEDYEGFEEVVSFDVSGGYGEFFIFETDEDAAPFAEFYAESGSAATGEFADSIPRIEQVGSIVVDASYATPEYLSGSDASIACAEEADTG